MTARIQACGDDALRLVTPSPVDRQELASRLREDAAWQEVVIGRDSVTVQFDPVSLAPEEAAHRLQGYLAHTATARNDRVTTRHVLTLLAGPEHAPDLEACARANGLDTGTFLDQVAASPLTVDMLGFAPGFAYISGVDPRLKGGRLAHPRTHVPAGSVGFIEGFLGIYALDGPGGWPIIGRISEPLFRPSREQPFVLLPGHRICLARG